MLKYIREMLIETVFYLKVKVSCIYNYLNLWKATDAQMEYFNDFMFLQKVKKNLNDLKYEEDINRKVEAQISSKDVSVRKPELKGKQKKSDSTRR